MTGEYTKTVEVDGRTVTLIWKQIQFGNDVENGITGHWFESRMVKGQPIDLIGYGENCRDGWGKISLNLNVYSIEGSQDLEKLGYIYHPDGPSDYITKGYPCFTVSSDIDFDLFLRYSNLLADEPESYWDFYNSRDRLKKFNEKYPQSDPDSGGRFYNDGLAFVRALNEGAVIQVGDDLWETRKGYDVYYIDEAMAMEDPSMYLSVERRTTKSFYWKVMVNDGKLIAVIAPAEWLKTQLSWPKKQRREGTFRFVTLFPLQAVLTTQRLSEDIGPFSFQDYGSRAGNPISIGGQSITTEFIAFIPNP